MEPVVEIDGSVLEGGGQILRTSAALSVLTQRSVHVYKIRSGRPKPGLRPQHLTGLEIIQAISNGKLLGATPDSEEVTLRPGIPRGGTFEADTRTAGSITLLVQVTLPCTLFANTSTILKFKGGTNTDMAPQLDYLTEIFRPTLERFGASFDYKVLKRGYYPRGGGIVHFRVQPIHCLKPITLLERGLIQRIWGWAFVAGNLPKKVANEIAEGATRTLQIAFRGIDVNIEAYQETEENSVGSASGINLVAQSSTGLLFGGSALGKRGEEPARTGQLAANELMESAISGSCVDDHCQDQIIIYMALANGISQVKVRNISEHTRTAIHICQILTEAKFSIIKTNDCANIIHCVGIGLQNTHLQY